MLNNSLNTVEACGKSGVPVGEASNQGGRMDKLKVDNYTLRTTVSKGKDGYRNINWSATYKDANNKTQTISVFSGVSYKSVGDNSYATKRTIDTQSKEED